MQIKTHLTPAPADSGFATRNRGPLGGRKQSFFLGEHFDRAGFFPVRSWRQRRLQAGRGSPPRAAAGGGQQGVIRAGGQPA